MSEHNGNIFCPLPFAHTNINTNGAYEICCRHPTPNDRAVNIKQATFEQWTNSEYVQSVKNSFRQNQQHPGCENCWNLEAVGQQSYRQRILKDYTFFNISTESDQLVNVQINLGNLCNLSCLMCDEKYSSSILAENKKLGINIHQQKDFSWPDSAFDHLTQIFEQKPKILTIVGGEPLYIKQFLELLEKVPESFFKETMLHITTNATIFNEKWAKVIKKFRLVRINFSLDATDELYEYIRFPGRWQEVTNNIQQIRKLENVKPLVNCVVQNLNIGRLSDIITWCMTQNLWLTLSQLSRPDFFKITNLPPSLKTQAIEELNKCLQIPNLPVDIKKFVESCQQQLLEIQDHEFDQELWNTCINYLNTRDQLRNNSHKKFLIY